MVVTQPPDDLSNDPHYSLIFGGEDHVSLAFRCLDGLHHLDQVHYASFAVSLLKAPGSRRIPKLMHGIVWLTRKEHHIAEMGLIVRPTIITWVAGRNSKSLYF